MNLIKIFLISAILMLSAVTSFKATAGPLKITAPATAIIPQTKVKFFTAEIQKITFCLTHFCQNEIVSSDYNIYYDLHVVTYASLSSDYEGESYQLDTDQTITEVVDICFTESVRCMSVVEKKSGQYTVSFWVSASSDPNPEPAPKPPGGKNTGTL